MPGIIEAFYGPPWTNEERRTVIRTLGPLGFSFYHYAPKADPQVREDWRKTWTDEQARALAGLRDESRSVGMTFGLGISPAGLQRGFGDEDQRDLGRRLEQINEIGPGHLIVLFDDERGDLSNLAERQAGIMDFVAERAEVDRLYCCPTYFSDDPLLDELFGQRPPGYLEALGHLLDPAIRIYWTGPRICSDTLAADHLQDIIRRLGRKPALWDNYPVDDRPDMIRHLHLRPFTDRLIGLETMITDHAANPALQAHLSLIPLLTLAPRFHVGPDRDAETAFREAAREILGPELAEVLETDLPQLQDRGLEQLDEREQQILRQRYETFDHPAAREIIRWLDGGYENVGPLAPGS
ncbi:MAG: beta-N-acetylglucosaminidase domain-containing protein [Gammaproteobacteria bacterium]|nr:beta-N-acetylglucosaminidase domain-containing protein [Gammaproteobacteria bacterium]